MPVQALKCKECDTAYPLDARYVCEHCFGPLEVTYDHSSLDDPAELRDILTRLKQLPAVRTVPQAEDVLTALAQLGCTPEAANRIARAVQNGMSYEAVVAQYVASHR